jgi:hypothetical protein
MAPVAIDHRPAKGLMVIQRCVHCGHTRANRVATDDIHQPDEIAAIAALSAGADELRGSRWS